MVIIETTFNVYMYSQCDNIMKYMSINEQAFSYISYSSKHLVINKDKVHVYP